MPRTVIHPTKLFNFIFIPHRSIRLTGTTILSRCIWSIKFEKARIQTIYLWLDYSSKFPIRIILSSGILIISRALGGPSSIFMMFFRNNSGKPLKGIGVTMGRWRLPPVQKTLIGLLCMNLWESLRNNSISSRHIGRIIRLSRRGTGITDSCRILLGGKSKNWNCFAERIAVQWRAGFWKKIQWGKIN